jgi:hypothetical protein
MSNEQNTIINENKEEMRQEFDIWQLEQDLKRLPEMELMHVYEIVESRLEKEFGKRLHL